MAAPGTGGKKPHCCGLCVCECVPYCCVECWECICCTYCSAPERAHNRPDRCCFGCCPRPQCCQCWNCFSDCRFKFCICSCCGGTLIIDVCAPCCGTYKRSVLALEDDLRTGYSKAPAAAPEMRR